MTIANGQKLELGADGWCLRGFVGSESELRGRLLFATPTGLGLHARLDLGLAAKLLRVRLLGTRTRDLSLCCLFVLRGQRSSLCREQDSSPHIAASVQTKMKEKGLEVERAAKLRIEEARVTAERKMEEAKEAAREAGSSIREKAQKEGEKVRERLKVESEKLKESVKSYTGKAEYQFGDLTKATWARLFPGGEGKEQGKDKVE